MAKADFQFHFTLRVRWSECDAQCIVFNGSYMDYMEIAQAEYYRNLGILLYDPAVAAYFDSVTVKATLEFKVPAHLDELLDIFTRVARIGTSSIVMESEIFRHKSEELLTRAEMVYVDYDSSSRAARPVPDDVRSLIGHFEDTGEILPLEGFPSAKTT